MRDAFEELKEKGVTVFGVSGDKVEAQKKFREKHQLPYDLLSDREGKIAKALGVPVKLGKFMGRRAFLFKNGELVWKDEKGATKTQGMEVLEALNALGG